MSLLSGNSSSVADVDRIVERENNKNNSHGVTFVLESTFSPKFTK